MQQIRTRLIEHLRQAQVDYQKFADRHRQAAPSFEVGDLVWLLRRDLPTKRPCAKLDYRRLGPFRIVEQVNNVAYRLELPASVRLHPVFHVSLLEPYEANTIPGRVPPPPPPLEVDDHEEFEVREILDSRISRHKLYYLVDWEGYSPSDRTWEPAENLVNAPEKVAAFHQRYPDKPGPDTSAPRRTSRRSLRRGVV